MRIVIVGGGVVGLCCGIALGRGGHDVTVIDASLSRSAASWNNAGHIATEQVAPLASMAMLRSAPRRRFAAGGALDLPAGQWATWLPFAARLVLAARGSRFRKGSAALRSLLAAAGPAWRRLAESLDDPTLLREAGHLVAWETPATAAAGRRAWAAADTGTATIGEPTGQDRDLLAAVMPSPARIAGAVRFEGTGQVRDLTRLADALEAALTAQGGRIIRDTARLTVEHGRATVASQDADLILVAAGAASGDLLRGTGHGAVPIVAERGYHIRAAADRWPADACPIVFEDRSMIVTRYDDTVQAASFVEIAGRDAPPDPAKWERLERHVAALGLPMRPPFTRWMGARPTLPDYLPAIGRSRRVGNLLYAFGHQHLGLTLAPLTGELVAAMVAGDTPAVDPAPFDLDRFSSIGGFA